MFTVVSRSTLMKMDNYNQKANGKKKKNEQSHIYIANSSTLVVVEGVARAKHQ
jgi:hypothetical protein